jgi:signal transduction histidine kinase
LRQDPALRTGQALSREQVNDHIPALLASFERDLRSAARGHAQPVPEAATAAQGQAHGLHRWHQGYDLREVTRELGHLNECVCVELDAQAQAHPEWSAVAMADARRRWARACTAAIGDSTTQFFRLQQLEAAGHIEELEGALADLQELEGLRALLWQQAAHDLRGNVAVVATATAGLAHPSVPDTARAKLLNLLQRNVQALNHLLGDVTTLARLQAGQETRKLQPLDAAALLRDLVQSLAGVAEQRGLALHSDGPPELPVQGDAVKLRRIVQNLVLNALTYTEHGGVDVAWGDAPAGDAKRWALTLRDTGPGLHGSRDALLAGALQQATSMSHGEAGTEAAAAATQPAAGGARGTQRVAGEGLGLSIVKRLCDLLDATVEVQSERGVGTTFTILFPRAYPAAAAEAR